MKLLKLLIILTIYYLVAIGCVALGWNVILPKVFEVPHLSFSQICWLTLALSLLGFPVTYDKE